MRQSLLLLGLSSLLAAQTACSGSITNEGVELSTSSKRNQPSREESTILGAREHRDQRRNGRVPGAQNNPVKAAPADTPQGAVKPRVTGGPNPAGQLPDMPFVITPKLAFNGPWAMTFLPDGRLLVTEKPGKLKLYNPATNTAGDITGLPAVAYGGQGGMGDVVLHPQFANNRYVYISYAEAGATSDIRGAVVARAKLTLDNNGGGSLGAIEVLWRQVPKVSGDVHYSHRIAFDGSGKLWITSGERFKFDPAQDMASNLGKVIRLNDDGSIPSDNPFAGQGGVAAQVWSLGHRNLLGIAFDNAGRLWEHEMGPLGGDELNLIERGGNYGWPKVSNGDNYDGTPIPDHSPGDGYIAPKLWWNPVVCPSGFIIYSGKMFPHFQGNGFFGGLCTQSLVRIQFDGTTAREVGRYPMGKRIREVEQGPDGAIWLLEDQAGGRLLKLTPVPM